MGLLDRLFPKPPPVIVTREPNPRHARPRRLSPAGLATAAPAPGAARPAEVVLLSEAVFSAISGDPDAAHTAAQMGSAYVRRLTAQAERSLPRLTEDRGREVAWWLYETNPLAKRVIELTRDYVIADGVAVTVPADRDDVAERPLAEPGPPPEQAVIDAFWTDPVNRMDRRLDALVTELGIFGDQFLTVAVNPVNGAVRLGMIDPGNVAEVIHDPLRPDEPMVVLVSPTAGPQGATGADRIPFKVVRRDDDPRSPSYGRLVGVRRDANGVAVDRFAHGDGAPPVDYAGSCFVWSVNKISTATRGKSDLFTLADWLDSLDQVLFGEVDRQLLSKAYVWDVTLTGMDATGIQEWLKLNGGTPKPGSFRAHNEKVAYAVVSPDLKTYDTGKAVDLFKDVVSAGGGIPKTWLSGTMDVNRACYSEDTQTLTDHGWKYYWEVEEGDRIATFNPDTQRLEFYRPHGAYLYPYAGEMVHFKGASVDVLVTPEHRMWAKLHGEAHADPWGFHTAEKLDWARFLFVSSAGWEGREVDEFVLPAAEQHHRARKVAPDRLIPMDDWLEFLGYVISEGCIFEPRPGTASVGQYRVTLSQKAQAKVATIDACLKKLPFAFASYVDSRGYTRWQVSDKGLWIWLREHVGRLSGDKRLPDMVKPLSVRQQRILFDALMLGDGTVDGRPGRRALSYATKSPRLADDVQELALKLGYRSHIRAGTRCLHVCMSPGRPHALSRQNVSRVPYDGMVYCFETTNHIFITRRNGRVGIHGNTATELAEPAFKRLTRRQRLIREYLSDLITYVLDQAELASRLPKRPAADGGLPEPWRFTIAMPELRPKDLKLAADTFAAAMQALAAARAEEAIDLDVAQEVVRLLVEQFGVEVDLDAMRQRLEAERAAHRAEMAAMRPPVPPDPQQPDRGAGDPGGTGGMMDDAADGEPRQPGEGA